MAAAPRDFAALDALVTARAAGLPRRLAQVAAYAMGHPDEVAFGTAAALAAHAGVQPSTLVRFSQALGYSGFSDLQQVFRSRLRDRVPSYAERLDQLRQQSGATAALLEGFADAAARSATGLGERLDPAALERAIATLAVAETIYLAGFRRSFPVTAYMAYALGKLGIRSVLIDGVAGLAPEQAAQAGADDVLLVVSFSPYAAETAALAGAARERGAKVVAITDSAFSPLAAVADVRLDVVEADFEGFRTMSGTLVLAMTLAVAVAERRGAAGVR